MNTCFKLSALGAVLVFSTAFASADTVTFDSNSSTTSYLGYSSTISGTPSSGSPQSVYNIANGDGTLWAAPLGSSSWVSYDANSGPTGTETGGTFDADGSYTYSTSVTTTGGNYVGFLSLMADDTSNVLLNGVSILSDGAIGSGAHCADDTPTCTRAVTISLGSDLSSFNSDGTNVLTFVVDQTGSAYQGLDFSGQITATPEPNTLMLLGTGLLGSAGVLFRRKRAV